jgi:hypothetical protein
MAGKYYVKDYPLFAVYHIDEQDGMQAYTEGVPEWTARSEEAARHILDEWHAGNVDGPFDTPPQGVPTFSA